MSLFRLNLKVVNETDQRTRFSLSIINLSAVDLNDWKLHFSITRFLDSQSCTVGSLSQVGSFCTLSDLPDLKQCGMLTTEFEMPTPPLQLQCDGILEAFVVSAQGDYSVEVMPLLLMNPQADPPAIELVTPATIAIIPKPNQLELKVGSFEFTRGESLYIETELANEAALWLYEAKEELYFSLGQSQTRISFKYASKLEDQAYQLDVSDNKICIYANSEQGFSYGVASLLQLINDDNSVPCVQINDSPAYGYRGMMLDCSRHFHEIEQVKLIIDQLARYKYNHFHWHLTDDEGWRIEINAFPELTDIGAWRAKDLPLTSQFRHIQSKYGGFYTQKQIKEVVIYAQRRGITVIPEIDIPGHCRAAIKSLPHLLLDSDDRSVYRSVQHYNDNVLSPALEGTYQFLDKVIEEVAELFPAPYVHIGADEVPEGVWTQSPRCQALMKEQGYRDEKDLQGHLLRYVENKLSSLGKRMLGWEEAQHGGKVSQQTVIYSWQSEQAAIDCARKGFDVVLQPGQYTYLDMAQEFDHTESGFYWANITPLKHAYHYQPLQEIEASDPIHKKVWGIQAGLWCELIDNEQKLQYMVHPRLQAIAEVCWTQADNKQWTDFLSRLKVDLKRLDSRGIHYRNPWH
ncbi:beta-hexosaminidase [Vibrio sp. UCD-FRSSP16_10]|uniref:beta-N-acetylhexosaminidase n=1 Tax=unclassified Vibrio TaxID=2614977 RepID=UPI0007FC937E|nr:MULTISPECIES: beta-N-acetylhexosaminidase [unclassified Vibrio]OBT17272.1 beta-hexosaminidase [Vibrio sp. UCD-FRSSP16_30]OBT23041.1 beta-hexosaminidase [Vibrio sp. UCD-FRSSP16_10]